MKTLTRAEEQIMQVIWKLEKHFYGDHRRITSQTTANTVAAIVKILVEKEFVGINVFGRMHQYYPLISKDAYSKTT